MIKHEQRCHYYLHSRRHGYHGILESLQVQDVKESNKYSKRMVCGAPTGVALYAFVLSSFV